MDSHSPHGDWNGGGGGVMHATVETALISSTRLSLGA